MGSRPIQPQLLLFESAAGRSVILFDEIGDQSVDPFRTHTGYIPEIFQTEFWEKVVHLLVKMCKVTEIHMPSDFISVKVFQILENTPTEKRCQVVHIHL